MRSSALSPAFFRRATSWLILLRAALRSSTAWIMRAPVGVDYLRAIDDGRERVELPAAAHAFAKHIHLLAKHAQVMHCYLPGIPSPRCLNPQFGSMTVLMLIVRLGTSTESITIFE